jgi:hypothetical protein
MVTVGGLPAELGALRDEYRRALYDWSNIRFRNALKLDLAEVTEATRRVEEIERKLKKFLPAHYPLIKYQPPDPG